MNIQKPKRKRVDVIDYVRSEEIVIEARVDFRDERVRPMRVAVLLKSDMFELEYSLN